MTAVSADFHVEKTILDETLVKLYPHQIEKNDTGLTLREVDQDSQHFNNLVASILEPRRDDSGNIVSDHGLLNPIVVRPLPGQPGKYAIVDGLHRITAWKKAFGDSKPIPANIIRLSEIGVVRAQIQANALSKKTKHAEFANAVGRMLDAFPEMTVEDVARDLSLEANTIKTWLSLTKLPTAVQEMVDSGVIPATVGFGLARFTDNTVNKDPDAKAFWDAARQSWLDRYLVLKDEPQGLQRWMGEAARALKQAKADRKAGKKAPSDEIIVAPVFRKKDEINIELKRTREDVETSPVTNDKVKAYATDHPDAEEILKAVFQRGYRAGLEYTLQLDEQTYKQRFEEAQKAKEQKQSAQEDKKAGKKAETIARATGGSLFGAFKGK